MCLVLVLVFLVPLKVTFLDLSRSQTHSVPQLVAGQRQHHFTRVICVLTTLGLEVA